MAEDYVEHGTAPFDTNEPGRVHGPTAMRETMKWLLDQFPDLHMHPSRLGKVPEHPDVREVQPKPRT
jgi:hypothetical protein